MADEHLSLSTLGEELLGCANRNILSDIVAATIAQATLEINLAAVKDSSARWIIAEHIRDADSLIDFCDNLTSRSPEQIPS